MGRADRSWSGIWAHRGQRSRSPPATHHPAAPQESLLRAQLPHFHEGFFQKSEPVVLGIMSTVSDVLHRLGRQGAGAQSLGVAINVHTFFDDVGARG